jgi:membrane protein
MVSLVGLFANPERVTKVLTDTVSELGPATSAKTFQAPIESITANRGTAGVLFFVGVLAALWSASGYVSAFAAASNSIYEVDEGRAFWKLKPLQLAVTLALILLAPIVALALILSGPIVGALGNALGISDSVLTLWRYAKWPAMLILVLLILEVLYYTAPNARVSGVRWVARGALVALVAWIVVSIAFGLYVANFSSYDKTYGTLGGVVVFLLWLWLTNMAILLGVQRGDGTSQAARVGRQRRRAQAQARRAANALGAAAADDGLTSERRIPIPPRRGRYGEGSRWIEVAPPGSAIAIALVPPSEGQSAGSDEAHCALTTEDIEADHATLRARGVDVDAEIARTGTPRSGLVSIEATVADPVPAQFFFRDTDGNRFLIVQPD